MRFRCPGFSPATRVGGHWVPGPAICCASRAGMRCSGPEVDWSGDDDNLVALGLGVPPLPLWAHGEPAEMPALLFSGAAMLARSSCAARKIGSPAPGGGCGEVKVRVRICTLRKHLPSLRVNTRFPGNPDLSLTHVPGTSYKGFAFLTDGARMAGTDKRKQSLYFPEDMLNEIQAEANRQDRSLSWIVQQAWRIARGEIMRFPSVNDVLSGVAREDEREVKGG